MEAVRREADALKQSYASVAQENKSLKALAVADATIVTIHLLIDISRSDKIYDHVERVATRGPRELRNMYVEDVVPIHVSTPLLRSYGFSI